MLSKVIIASTLAAILATSFATAASSQCDRTSHHAFANVLSFSPQKNGCTKNKHGQYENVMSNYACWSPPVTPTPDHTLAFLSSTVFLRNSNLLAKNIFVDANATVMGEDIALSATECITIQGRIHLSSSTEDFYYGYPYFNNRSYPNDHLLPTCTEFGGGFMSRVCGPGQLYVAGDVLIEGKKPDNSNYWEVPVNSLFAPTLIAASGTLTLSHYSHHWSLVQNYGTYNLKDYSVFHGGLQNHGKANMGYATFGIPDKARSHTPLVVENAQGATLVFRGPFQAVYYYMFSSINSFNFTLRVLNSGNLTITDYGEVASVFWQVEWYNNRGYMKIEQDYEPVWLGTFYNQGKLDIDGTNVWADHYLCQDCHVSTQNGGYFQHGNWRRPTEPTWMFEQLAFIDAAKEKAGADGAKHADADSAVRGGGSYYGFLPSADDGAAWASSARRKKQKSSTDAATNKIVARAAFKGRCTIDGDGTGAVAMTIPPHLFEGAVLDIGSGGRFVSNVEHQSPVHTGAGQMRVSEGGLLTLGLDATLSGGGQMRILPGGRLYVPLHARVTKLGNYSFAAECSSEVTVNGEFSEKVKKGCVRLSGIKSFP